MKDRDHKWTRNSTSGPMDVAGAEALAQRIAEQSGSDIEAADVRDDAERTENFAERRSVDRPFTPPEQRPGVAQAGAVATGNGGGAGALRERILERHGAAADSVVPVRTLPIASTATRKQRSVRLGRFCGPWWHAGTVLASMGLSAAVAFAVTDAAADKSSGTPVTAPSSISVPSHAPVPAPSTISVPSHAPVSAAVDSPRIVLHGLASYNPFGTGPEHGDFVSRATDGRLRTYWTTETYVPGGFQKPGTGLVLAAPSDIRFGRVEIVTTTPGFQAQIRVSDSPDGGFRADSRWETVGAKTMFELRGRRGRYWLVWLRLPNHTGSARINEVRAFR